ncbi:aspartate kinase [Carbonactinospora thermoautotrophica]|uniref:aspartate kinase n=1 Tax=Carbonactinospora thermoautotrophica TaxID=1469144 RepID=UPI0022712074|nr:aspartate kinase [Carbonactinospora thermoautotrophica]MCX9192907.1 aspartate kinase [Carbonactinospora thermoautotrophica]
MDVLVQKYGGSSLATLDRVSRVAKRVAETHWAGQPVVVVVSARGDTTDSLLRLAAGTSPIRPPREVDQLLVTGECASAALLAMALHGLGVPTVSLTGWQAGLLVSGKHGAGVIVTVRTDLVTRLLAEGNVVVVAGFHGVNAHGDVITLGRGGSDTTAVALAAELRAIRCEIYTDVEGVYTADPRIVPSARLLSSVDPAVMAEMAFAGAKVLHSRSVELAAMQGIELHVRSSFSGGSGTVIPGRSEESMLETRGVVIAITHDTDVARVLVRCEGGRRDLAADVLAVLARHSVPVDLVARSGPYEDELRIGFTIRRSDVAEIREPLRSSVAEFGGEIQIDENVGKLSLIGMGLLNRPEYTVSMLSALAAAGIPTSWISTSQLRSSVVVPIDRLFDAVEVLHREFELERGDLGVGSMAPA